MEKIFSFFLQCKAFMLSVVIVVKNEGLNNNNNNNNNTRPYNNEQQKIKRICKIVDFAVPGDHRIKLKECEKKDKYLDLARELKKIWNMKVKIVPSVISAFGTVKKGLLNGLEDLEVGGRVETIVTKTLLRMARILRRVLETSGDLLSLKLQWKTITWCWSEKLQWGCNKKENSGRNLETF